MAGDASAYAALELEPGADAAAIEQAYRRLIKQHHPDRVGGDSRRAAEITSAYRELRKSGGLKDPLEFHDHAAADRPRRPLWAAALVALGAMFGTLFLLGGPTASVDRTVSRVSAANLRLSHAFSSSKLSDPMDQPLRLAAIDRAIRDASAIARARDETALVSESRSCLARFHSSPSVVLLDRCAAFDDAVVELQDRDPVGDEGPFSQLAVTGRQWSAASALTDDYLAIDSRLHHIRLHVELALAPAEPPPPPPPPPRLDNRD